MAVSRILSRGSVALTAALLLASAASALNITGLTPALGGSNTANNTTNTGQNFNQTGSSLTTTQAPVAAPDVVGSFSEFITRYAMIVALDRQNTSGTATVNMTSSYSITFTVDNPTGATVQVDIDTLRIGALTNITDSTGNAVVTLGALTGQLDSGLGLQNQAGLGAAAVAQNQSGTLDTPFNQAGSTVTILTNATTSTYILQFDFSSSVVSAWDEGAIRMGIAGAVNSSTADDYPGVTFPRTATNDGHFVNVTTTIISVPEPAPAALLGLGLVALALRGRRARQ